MSNSSRNERKPHIWLVIPVAVFIFAAVAAWTHPKWAGVLSRKRENKVAQTGGEVRTVAEAGQAVSEPARVSAVKEVNPAEASNTRGLEHLRANQHDQAIQSFSEAIRLSAGDAVLYYNRGVARHRNGYWAQLSQKNSLGILSDVESSALRREFRAILDDYVKCLALDPTLADAYYMSGELLLGYDSPVSAVEDYTECIRLGTSSIAKRQVLLRRAEAYKKVGKYSQAAEDYSEAIRLDPNPTSELFFERGMAYEQDGKPYKAIADYTEVVRMDAADWRANSAQLRMNRLTDKVRRESKTNVRLISVAFDTELKQKRTKTSPPIRLPENTEKVWEDTIKVQHSVTTSSTWKAEAEVKGKVSVWFAEVETSVRSGIERSTSRTYGVETERKRSVTLKGDHSPQMRRVVWVDVYRTGTATLDIGGEIVSIPFEFKEDFDLLAETVG